MPFPARPAENADPWYDERETYDQAIEDAVTAAETKLAGIATGATANDTDANLKARANHTGTQTAATISDFDTEVGNHTDVAANTAARHTHANSAILAATTASFLTADETKLDGIATGATANATNAELRTRSSHTGTQLASTISDFASTVSAVTDVVNNTAARHTHSNKALLDTYTQTEANIADAVTKKHAHANSAVLDATTASFTAADETKLDGIEALADVTDAANVAAAGAVMEADTTTASMSFVIDEDSFATDSATKVPTQQSVKAYVDTEVAGAGGGAPPMTIIRDWRSGAYWMPSMGPLTVTTTTGEANAASNIWMSPIAFPESTNVDRMLVNVSTLSAGGSGNVMRLGLFTYDPSTTIGTLVKDFGTVSTTGTGWKEASSTAVAVTADTIYYVAAVTSDAAARHQTWTTPLNSFGVTAAGVTAFYGPSLRSAVTESADAVAGFDSSYTFSVAATFVSRIGVRKA